MHRVTVSAHALVIEQCFKLFNVSLITTTWQNISFLNQVFGHRINGFAASLAHDRFAKNAGLQFFLFVYAPSSFNGVTIKPAKLGYSFKQVVFFRVDASTIANRFSTYKAVSILRGQKCPGSINWLGHHLAACLHADFPSQSVMLALHLF